MSDLISRLRDPYIAGCVGFTDVVLEAADALESQAKRIAELEAERDAANSRIELLESDMKSGDYESLYGQAVQQLSDATEAQQVLGLKLAQVETERNDAKEEVQTIGKMLIAADKSRLELTAERDALKVDRDGWKNQYRDLLLP